MLTALVIGLTAAVAGAATPPQVDAARDRGLAWLVTHQRGDGSWRGVPGTEAVATATALDALRAANVRTEPYAAGVAWLSNATIVSVDSLSRQIAALAGAGLDVRTAVARLVAWRNTTLAWGAYEAFHTSHPDTALALTAIRAAQYPAELFTEADLVAGLCRILSAQAAPSTPAAVAGSWAWSHADIYGPANAPPMTRGGAILPTVYALLEIDAIRVAKGWTSVGNCPGLPASTSYHLATAVTNGLNWLTTQKWNASDGGFGDGGVSTVLDTALAYHALATLRPTDSRLGAALDYLVLGNRQRPDGSWNGDAFQTALVLKVIPIGTPYTDTDADGAPDRVEASLATDPSRSDSRWMAPGNGLTFTGTPSTSATSGIVASGGSPPGTPGGPPIQLIDGRATTATSATAQVTFPAVRAGDLLIVFLRWTHDSQGEVGTGTRSLVSVTDSAGASLTHLPGYPFTSVNEVLGWAGVDCAYTIATRSGPETITVAYGGDTPSVTQAYQFRGVDLATPINGHVRYEYVGPVLDPVGKALPPDNERWEVVADAGRTEATGAGPASSLGRLVTTVDHAAVISWAHSHEGSYGGMFPRTWDGWRWGYEQFQAQYDTATYMLDVGLAGEVDTSWAAQTDYNPYPPAGTPSTGNPGVQHDYVGPNFNLDKKSSNWISIAVALTPIVVPPGPDTTPPIVWDVRAVPGITDIQVTWETNEATTGTVEYGVTPSFELPAASVTVAQEDHTITLGGLTPETTYQVRVVARDASGNTTVSPTATVRTLPPDTTPPQIVNAGVVAGSMGILVTWATDETATGTVEYGVTPALGTAVGETDGTQHALVLTGLQPGTTYYLRRVARDASGNVSVSPIEAVPTPAPGAFASDEFAADSLDGTRWIVRDARGDSRVSVNGAQLVIEVPAGTSHNVWTNDNMAPRVLQRVANGDLDLVAKFDAQMSRRFQMQGIIVEQDAANFVRFDLHHDGAEVRVFAATFRNGVATVRYNVGIGARGAPLWLRVTRVGDRWTLASSVDGVSWTGVPEFTEPLVAAWAGVFAGNAEASPAFTALVDAALNTAAPSGPPPPDTTAPVITTVNAVAAGPTAIHVTWTTDEPATGTVEYGSTLGYELGAVNGASAQTQHAITLGTLTADTTYHLRLVARDASGNETRSQDVTVRTAAADTTPPVMTGGNAEVTGPTEIRVTWTTNEPATGTVEYGSTLGYELGAVNGASAQTQHAITLTQLTPDTTYHVRLVARDASGNEARSEDFTVRTLPPDTTPPVLSSPTATPAPTEILVTWTTNETATGTVRYGPTLAYELGARSETNAGLQHSVRLTGLTADTTYHVQVSSVDPSGNTATSQDLMVSTLPPPVLDTTAPVMSHPRLVTGVTGIEVRWTTDEAARGTVEYGLTPALGQAVNETALATAHAITLTGLAPATTYYVRRVSRDASDNVAVSAIEAVRTAAPGAFVSDGFGAGSLDGTRWVVKDPRGDSTVTVDGARLSIAVAAGRTHDAWATDNTAPRVIQRVANGDLDLVVKLDAAMSTQFQMQGLVFEQDDATRVRFDLHHDGARVNVFAASFVNGQATARHNSPVGAAGAPRWLRVTRVGDRWMQAYSLDGATWVAAADFVHPLVVAWAGVFAGNSGLNPAFTALVDSVVDAAAPGATPLPDTTPPAIADASAVNAVADIVVTWTTDEPATGTVEYGETLGYERTPVSEASARTEHALTLTGLTADTTYHVRVVSADASGNTATSQDIVVRTPATPDTAAPVMSSVTATAALTEVVVTWTTNEPATGTVRHGPTVAYELAPVSEASARTEHAVTLTGLAPDTTYHVLAVSTDAGGNTATSQDIVVHTLAAPDTTPPVMSSVVPAAGVTDVVVTWTTNEPATGTVEYGETLAYEVAPVSEPSARTQHAVTLTGLTADTAYHVRVVSVDPSGNQATSEGFTVRTLVPGAPDTTPPVMSTATVQASATAIRVAWTTDEPAMGTVQYGLTPGLGLSAGDGVLRTAHDVTLTGLTPATTYSVRRVSRDASGNESPSATEAVATAAPGAFVSDEFAGASLDGTRWIVKDGGGDGTVTVHDGRLAIGVPSGTTHDLWTGNERAPRVLQRVANGDLEVVAKLDAGMSTQFQMQGLVFEQDDATRVRFDLHHDGTQVKAFAASFVNDQVTMTDTRVVGPAGSPLWLRVTRVGDRWKQAYSLDGVNWLAAADFVQPLVVAWAGVFAGNAGANPAFTALVDSVVNTGAPSAPPSDVTPPIITNENAVATGPTEIRVTWTTGEPATGTVEYGLTEALGSQAIGAAPATEHTVVLTALAPATTYHVRVVSQDASGNLATSALFTVQTGTDTTPPVITNESAVAAGATAIQVTWTTNEPATRQVEYGLTPAFELSPVSAAGTGVQHSVLLSGLTPDTTYHVRPVSRDAGGNTTAGSSFVLQTPPPPDATPPVMSSVEAVPGFTEIEVTWTTDEPAIGTVQYGLTQAFELGPVTVAGARTQHSIAAAGLRPDTTYWVRVTSTDPSGNVAVSPGMQVKTTARSSPSAPTITVWYGPYQRFGHNGRPQPWVNILGNVSDADGIQSLTYSLNGQPDVVLARGPDTRRLVGAGDFNADIAYTQLLAGLNTVLIIARDTVGETAAATVVVENTIETPDPTPVTIDWGTVAEIQDAAQVVDGLWEIVGSSLQPVQLGYDRLIGIGDSSWVDYEVTVPVMIHEIDPAGYAWPSVAPGLGILMRWNGHYTWGGSQPRAGYTPLGGLGWYSWRTGGGERFEIIANNEEIVAKDLTGRQLELQVQYVFKMRVETVLGQGNRYSLKVWRAEDPEPAAWDLVALAADIYPQVRQGGFLLVAHHVRASFGTVTMQPLP
jgi:hypothetical protein